MAGCGGERGVNGAVNGPAKRALRRQLLAARAALTTAELTRRAAALGDVAAGQPVLNSARCVAAYVSVDAEPGTGPLLERLRTVGVRVLLPVLGPGRSLDWALDEGPERLQPGPFGLLEPVGPRLGPAAVGSADVVLVPALAVDHAGHRLGRGGGYYDRVLSVLPAATTVLAVVYDEEVLRAVPVEVHDRPVAGVLTPTRWRPLG